VAEGGGRAPKGFFFPGVDWRRWYFHLVMTAGFCGRRRAPVFFSCSSQNAVDGLSSLGHAPRRPPKPADARPPPSAPGGLARARASSPGPRFQNHHPLFFSSTTNDDSRRLLDDDGGRGSNGGRLNRSFFFLGLLGTPQYFWRAT